MAPTLPLVLKFLFRATILTACSGGNSVGQGYEVLVQPDTSAGGETWTLELLMFMNPMTVMTEYDLVSNIDLPNANPFFRRSNSAFPNETNESKISEV